MNFGSRITFKAKIFSPDASWLSRHIARSYEQLALHFKARLEKSPKGLFYSDKATGDPRIFTAACAEARSKFSAYRALDPENPETEQKTAEAKEVARLLRQNIVQGEPIEGREYRYRTFIASVSQRK